MSASSSSPSPFPALDPSAFLAIRPAQGGHGHFASVTESVVTAQTTTSTTYTDLATVGPVVTLGVQGLALVVVYMNSDNNTALAANLVGIDMTGANVQATTDAVAVVHRCFTTDVSQANSSVFLFENLNYGTTTFTLKYRVTAGTGTFQNRRLSVIPIPTHTHPTGAAPGGGT